MYAFLKFGFAYQICIDLFFFLFNYKLYISLRFNVWTNQAFSMMTAVAEFCYFICEYIYALPLNTFIINQIHYLFCVNKSIFFYIDECNNFYMFK